MESWWRLSRREVTEEDVAELNRRSAENLKHWKAVRNYLNQNYTKRFGIMMQLGADGASVINVDVDDEEIETVTRDVLPELLKLGSDNVVIVRKPDMVSAVGTLREQLAKSKSRAGVAS